MNSDLRVFRGRTSAKGLYVGQIAFFSVLFLFGWSPLLLGSKFLPLAIVMGLMMSVVMAMALSATLPAYFLTMGSVALDDAGIRIETPIVVRKIPWADLISANPSGHDGLKLSIRGQRASTLYLEVIEDGPELARLITARLDEKEDAPVSDDLSRKFYRPIGLTSAIAVTACLLIFPLALFYMIETRPVPPANQRAVIVDCLLGLLGCNFILFSVCSRWIRLTGSMLLIHSLSSKKSVPLAEIRSIAPRTGGKKGWSIETTSGIQHDLAGYSELHELIARLRAKLPAEAFENASQNAPLKQGMFGPKKGAWIGPVTLLAFGALLLGLGIQGVVSAKSGGEAAIGWMCIVLFGAASLGCIAMLLETLTSYAVDEEGIERLHPRKRTRILWKELNHMKRVGERLQSYRLSGGGVRMNVDTSFLADRVALLAAIEAHTKDFRTRVAPVAEGKVFRTDRAMTWLGIMLSSLIGFGATSVFYFLEPARRPEDTTAKAILCAMSFGTGMLLLAMTISLAYRSFHLLPDGVEAKSWRGTRFHPFSKMTRVELGVVHGSKSSRRTLRVEDPLGGFLAMSSIEDFDLLSEAIIKQVDASIVRRA